MEIQDKNQNTQWDDTEKKNNTQPFIYLYISSAHGQTLSTCEKTKNKNQKIQGANISWFVSRTMRTSGQCLLQGSRSNAVHTSLYLSSLFVAHWPHRQKAALEVNKLSIDLHHNPTFLVSPAVDLCTNSVYRPPSRSHLIHPPRFMGMPGGGGRGTCDCPGGTGGGGGYPAGGRPKPGGGTWPGGIRGGGGG